ncbi:MAG: hypothetical protein ACK4V1_04075 [Burkholderiaceae bacterium]
MAVDGSRHGEAAVRFLLEHREWFGEAAQIAVLHALRNCRCS